jgi:hypothetical protein
MIDMENTQQEDTIPKTEDDVIRKAYQFVGLSVSIAIQDAVDNLRGINAICTTIMGAAMTQALEDGQATEQVQKIIEMAQRISDTSAENCQRIIQNNTALLNNFPKG